MVLASLRSGVVFAVVALTLSLAAHAQKPPADIAPTDLPGKPAAVLETPPTPPSATAGPALWRVSDADSDVWLFGTVHILDPDTVWRRAAVDEAFEAASIVYFETPSGSEVEAEMQVLVARHGRNLPGVSLTSLLTPRAREGLNRLSRRLNLPVANLQPLRPWLASVYLGVQLIIAEGGDPDAGVDAVLEAEAIGAGKQVRYFETAEQQIRFFADLPGDVELRMLEASLRQVDLIDDLTRELHRSWLNADLDRLSTLITEGFVGAPEAYSVLITRRNVSWVEEIDALMEGSGTAFIAVGAGHLVGNDGVPALLEARGHVVERR